VTDLNIRKIDDDLVAKAKSKAALEKRSLKAVVIDLLENYVGETPNNVKKDQGEK
jgi:plasmid stability protein